MLMNMNICIQYTNDNTNNDTNNVICSQTPVSTATFNPSIWAIGCKFRRLDFSALAFDWREHDNR